MAKHHQSHLHKKQAYNKTSIRILAILTVIISTTPHVSPTLTVEPTQQAVEVGDKAVFVCKRDDNDNLTAIVWTFGSSSNSVIISDTTSALSSPTSSSSSPNTSGQQRATSINGTLTIRNATKSDHGTYFCSVTDILQTPPKQEGKLVVYVMSDYLEELYGIGATCLFLLIVLISLTLYKTVRQKQATRKDVNKQVNSAAISTVIKQENTMVEKGDKPV